jgi:hypothetical protein
MRASLFFLLARCAEALTIKLRSNFEGSGQIGGKFSRWTCCGCGELTPMSSMLETGETFSTLRGKPFCGA